MICPEARRLYAQIIALTSGEPMSVVVPVIMEMVSVACALPAAHAHQAATKPLWSRGAR
jgi:hypothetical protein